MKRRLAVIHIDKCSVYPETRRSWRHSKLDRDVVLSQSRLLGQAKDVTAIEGEALWAVRSEFVLILLGRRRSGLEAAGRRHLQRMTGHAGLLFNDVTCPWHYHRMDPWCVWVADC